MSGHAKKLSDLGITIPNQLGIHRVLQSLPPSYKNFVMNYNMQNMNKELPELFTMLKSAEIEIKKEHQVLMVNKTTSFKKQGKAKKGNFKKGGKKAAAPPEKPKGGPKPDTDCYYCNGKGHWKRNCPKYLADLKSGLVKKKKGISDIHVIDVYLTGSRTSAWCIIFEKEKEKGGSGTTGPVPAQYRKWLYEPLDSGTRSVPGPVLPPARFFSPNFLSSRMGRRTLAQLARQLAPAWAATRLGLPPLHLGPAAR
ncbi:hypothetical protein QYE76_031471 [Lolium multiflorum]|uniref:CCHC-type domain-containing protein n=1 Tax=Lolium multiflorum TaxID=4521 RepID=A0AAD8QVE4_LOLMU|nr:hypothetical protein QYE76_031471 [Lolium multiflorum]